LPDFRAIKKVGEKCPTPRRRARHSSRQSPDSSRGASTGSLRLGKLGMMDAGTNEAPILKTQRPFACR
jgi:hypothetical protein